MVEYKPLPHSLARRLFPYSPVFIFATKVHVTRQNFNSSEARFHEVIRTVEAKHPKAEIGVEILTPNPKERLENQKKSSLMVGNTTKARIKALMAQLVKEYLINNKYSKEASVYINTANPKEYIHITYEMRKKWARMILEEVPTVTISRPPLFEADFQPWLVLGSKKTNIEKDNNVEWVQPYGQPLGFPYGTFAYSVPPWIAQPGMPFGLGNGSTQQQPSIPSPELPPQEGDYSFDRFLEFSGLNLLDSFE
ncbi:hypothetical protein BY996DRAFT_6411130 [Phakopsora pachyrhizi]|nr:hypothetical protein BY996DRAFT_6411130 [Phakopsora pachyrhizi]